ncbi:MAG: N-acetyltransferase [Bdellovibrionota bacterium]
MDITTRFLKNEDAATLVELYRVIASKPGGFVRTEEEIDSVYVEKTLRTGERAGIAIGAFDVERQRMIGAITARKPGLKVFDHVLTGLIIGVQPEYQSQGIGRRLFLDFIEHVQANRPDILRIELLARDSNQRQISFYEGVGFRREGFFENRIRRSDGSFEGDVPMAWLKPD